MLLLLQHPVKIGVVVVALSDLLAIDLHSYQHTTMVLMALGGSVLSSDRLINRARVPMSVLTVQE